MNISFAKLPLQTHISTVSSPPITGAKTARKAPLETQNELEQAFKEFVCAEDPDTKLNSLSHCLHLLDHRLQNLGA